MNFIYQEAPINRKYLGADTQISPDVIALINEIKGNGKPQKTRVSEYADFEKYWQERGL